MNLSRYSDLNEQIYRNHFARDFNFLEFNMLLTEQTSSRDRVLAIDPLYIQKSGKHTDGVGFFGSGCAGNNKWGLEILVTE